jgi:two-component system, response regulator PdtaR
VARPRERSDAPTRVLVVEDDFLIAYCSADTLAAAGLAVSGIAATFEEAVALAERERPDLVLMDIRLASERDGIDAAIAIRERFGIRCIFASANIDPENRKRADAAEALGWLPKPYSPEMLIEAVTAACGPAGLTGASR